MGSHDTIRDIFVSITKDASFHVSQKELNVFLSTMFNSFQQINIVFTKDGICTLVNVVIIDPRYANLLLQSCTTKGFTTSDAARAKEKNYCN